MRRLLSRHLLGWIAGLCLAGVLLWPQAGWSAPLSEQRFLQRLAKVKSAYDGNRLRRCLLLAKTLFSPAIRQIRPSLRARLHLYVGMSLFRQKFRSVAWKSFDKALDLNPYARLPSGQSGAMGQFFARVKRDNRKRRGFRSPYLTGGKSGGGGGGGGGQVWLALAFGSGALALGALGGAGVAALNATTARQSLTQFDDDARRNRVPEPLMTPSVQSIYDKAVTQSVIANALYITGGVLALASVAFGVLYIVSRPTRVASKHEKPRRVLVKHEEGPLPHGAFVVLFSN